MVLLNIFTFSLGKEPSAEDPEVVADSRPPSVQLSLNLGENEVKYSMCVSQDVLFVYWSWLCSPYTQLKSKHPNM